MPIFDYRCRACGRVFWKVVGLSKGEPPPSCPDCRAEDPEKLISAFNTKFYLERAEAAGRDLLKEMNPEPARSPRRPPAKRGRS